MAKKSGAQLQREYWYNVYHKVFDYYGVNYKDVKRITKATIESLKKKYAKLAEEKELGGIRQTYKDIILEEESNAEWREQPRIEDYRTTETPTIDIDAQVINDFIATVEAIYSDTLAFADSNSKLAGILATGYDRNKGMSNIDSLSRSKSELLEFIAVMYEESNNNRHYVAEAIKRSADLDYTLAVTLIPPSDIIFDFDLTLENLKAIWTQIVNEVKDAQEGSTYY